MHITMELRGRLCAALGRAVLCCAALGCDVLGVCVCVCVFVFVCVCVCVCVYVYVYCSRCL
jgi:hypothetical protein